MMPARAVPGESWGFPQDPNFEIASGGKGVADDGSVYLKLDEYQWRIGIHQDDNNHGILYIGFEVDNVTELEEAKKHLLDNKIDVLDVVLVWVSINRFILLNNIQYVSYYSCFCYYSFRYITLL